MKEINIPKSANGYIYTITSVETKTIVCPKRCNYIKEKDYDCWYVKKLNKLGIIFDKGKFKCISVCINVKNLSDNATWVVGAEDAVLVDSEGFTYNGIILCEDCLPPRIVEDRTIILPQTQVNYIQVFPIPISPCEISKIKINIFHQWTDFQIGENYNPFEELAVLSLSATPISHANNISYVPNEEARLNWQLQSLTERINRLKTNIYSRFNNILTESEKTKLENRISNDIYNIKVELESRSENIFDSMRNTINDVECSYKQDLQTQITKEGSRNILIQKIDELLELSPREFEQYIGELFTHLGYAVEVTQYSNDKGIDIIMTKDDIKYGVQCKRYKGTVGSPDIQKFIGALSHLQADKGFFVTTGMFSFEAEKMAAQHPIQLINRINLAKLILNALNN